MSSKIVLKYVGGGIYQGLPARDMTAADLVEYETVIEAIGGLDAITAPSAPYQRAEETKRQTARHIPAVEEVEA